MTYEIACEECGNRLEDCECLPGVDPDDADLYRVYASNDILAGLDWITITGKDLHGQIDALEQLVDWQDRLQRDYQPKDWRLLGYAGKQVGPVRMGFRDDVHFIAQISGAYANDALEECPELAGLHFTRVDYQVTARSSMTKPDYVSLTYERLRFIKQDYPSYPNIKLIRSDTGDTLYIGRRDSPLMLRLYDKSFDLGHPLGTWFRFEVEYKKNKANPAWQAWLGAPNRIDHITDVVGREFSDKRIPTWFGSETVVAIHGEVIESDYQRQLRWLDKCVRPAVVKLSEAGYRDEARRILFGEIPTGTASWGRCYMCGEKLLFDDNIGWYCTYCRADAEEK